MAAALVIGVMRVASHVRREQRSMITASLSQPCHVRMSVMSITQALFGRVTVNCRSRRLEIRTESFPPSAECDSHAAPQTGVAH